MGTVGRIARGYAERRYAPIMALEIVRADITTLDVHGIVNAANESLLGGGGVDGAIHDAAGPGLLAECRTLGGCKTGDAKITKGYDLPARHVIHAVGPRWRGGSSGEPALLESAYRRSLEIARDRRLASVAFPAISTGIFAFPLDAACAIAVRVVSDFQRESVLPDRVVLVAFDTRTEQALRRALHDRLTARLASH
jgi:O-acetyl-ADP-ribose deacetylase (regulator of RNase III)